MAQLARAIKTFKPFDLVKPLLGTFSKEIIRLNKKAISVKMFTAPLSIIAKMWKPHSQQDKLRRNLIQIFFLNVEEKAEHKTPTH